MSHKYAIYKINAKALLRNAKETESGYSFYLSPEATELVIDKLHPVLQEDCPLFHQIMREMYGEEMNFHISDISEDLKEVLIFVDFAGIFDRQSGQMKYTKMQEKAEWLFRPQGISLDFGKGSDRFIAFERSNSMSRNSQLSFIREDYYEKIHKRITLGMDIGLCQLSKLYAYNGLMLTSGFRVNDSSVLDPEKIIVIDNPRVIVPEANVISVEPGEKTGCMRKYTRIEECRDLEIMQFDGEGLMSKEYSAYIDSMYFNEHLHSSFQIRLPYIKGVVHEVDFKSLFNELGIPFIVDVWGKHHKPHDVEFILTKSMFKGFGWMTENNLSWEQYIERCREYGHSLYISGVNQTFSDQYTELNYQFLNTADIKAEEFRPSDLPDGWIDDPEKDKREWITKATEAAYYHAVADRDAMIQHFTGVFEAEDADPMDKFRAVILKKNPLFLNEPYFAKELEDHGNKILKNYSLGKLLVLVDNRYLSDDLMRLIQFIASRAGRDDESLSGIASYIDMNECSGRTAAYIPQAAYPENPYYTLLRNPHIARNEEAIVLPLEHEGRLRKKYLSHLNYVVMVESKTLLPERLGGADFDGDMVKIIADPLVNRCIHRNYRDEDFDPFEHRNNIPLLKIPSEEPEIRDAKDWMARFETVRNTFSSHIGQICNAAFNRSIIAYDENSDTEDRRQMKEETEVLEILTGLEIDSAKSGIKPDLSEFFKRKIVNRSPFLKYKAILDEKEKRQWYEPTMKDNLDKYFASIDFSKVTSNVERLPYLAKQLAENTPKVIGKPVRDEELFSFAQDPNWKKKLDKSCMEITRQAISDYDTALKRIRIGRLPAKDMSRRSDIERILYSRGQEETYSADELYSVFQNLSPRTIAEKRKELTELKWQLMPKEEREDFLIDILPYDCYDQFKDVFSDFRAGGYRILGDIICDLDDKCRADESKARLLNKRNTKGLLYAILSEYAEMPDKSQYREMAAKCLRYYLRHNTNTYEAVKCAVALNRRSLMLEAMPAVVLEYTLERR